MRATLLSIESQSRVEEISVYRWCAVFNGHIVHINNIGEKYLIEHERNDSKFLDKHIFFMHLRIFIFLNNLKKKNEPNIHCSHF